MEKLLHDALDNLRSTVTCSICLGYYVRPVTLSCHHSYCEQCIAPVLSAKKICPICSSDIRRRNIVYEDKLQCSIQEVSAFVTTMETILPAPTVKPRSSTLQCKPHSSAQPEQTAKVALPADVTLLAPSAVVSQLAVPEWSTFAVGELVMVAQRTFAGMSGSLHHPHPDMHS